MISDILFTFKVRGSCVVLQAHRGNGKVTHVVWTKGKHQDEQSVERHHPEHVLQKNLENTNFLFKLIVLLQLGAFSNLQCTK